MTNEKSKVPSWFWIVAILALLWNFMGASVFVQHVTMTDEAVQALPDAERKLYGQYPLWTIVAFAFAVFGGLLGSIGLLLRKKWAKPVFLISLIGVLIQMAQNMFLTDAIEVYGPSAAIMPIMVIIIAILLLWFSKISIQKGWV